MQQIVQDVGRNKLVPDISSEERFYTLSLDIRALIAEFLQDNVGSQWPNLSVLHAQAANYARCAMTTASRWVLQLTQVGTDFRLVRSVDRWILERRQ